MSTETGEQLLKKRFYSAENDDLVAQLRTLSLKALRGMYRPEAGLFCFSMRRTLKGIVPEGASRRYTAIVIIGLAGEERTRCLRYCPGNPWANSANESQ